VPRGLGGEWDRARLAAETIALLRARGGALREHVVTDVVPFDEGPRLLHDLADRRREPIQAVFAFEGASHGADPGSSGRPPAS